MTDDEMGQVFSQCSDALKQWNDCELALNDVANALGATALEREQIAPAVVAVVAAAASLRAMVEESEEASAYWNRRMAEEAARANSAEDALAAARAEIASLKARVAAVTIAAGGAS